MKPLIKIGKLKYSGGGDEFESQVFKVLIGCGFKELLPFDKKKSNGRSSKVEKFLKNHRKVPHMTFISQPRGTHGSPDYWVYMNGKKIELECKSSKSGSVKWNSGRPHNDILYAFNCGRTNKTYMFLGQDHIGDMSDFDKHIIPALKAAKKSQDEINKLIVSYGYGDNFYQNFRTDWLDKSKIHMTHNKTKKLNLYKYVKGEVKCC